MQFPILQLLFIALLVTIPAIADNNRDNPSYDNLQSDVDLLSYQMTMKEFPNQNISPWNDSNEIMLRGLMSYNNQKYNQAKEIFHEILDKNQSNPDAWYYYGMSLSLIHI